MARADLAALGVGPVELLGLAVTWGQRAAVLPRGPVRDRVVAEGAALWSLARLEGHADGLAVVRRALAALRHPDELPGALEARACSTHPLALAELELDGEAVRARCASCAGALGEARVDRAGLPADVLERLPRAARSEAA